MFVGFRMLGLIMWKGTKNISQRLFNNENQIFTAENVSRSSGKAKEL